MVVGGVAVAVVGVVVAVGACLVSVVVAEIVMQNAEEQALASYSETVPLWIRYVDDTIIAVNKNKLVEFPELLQPIYLHNLYTRLHITHLPTATLSIDQSNRSVGFLNFQLT